MNRFKYTLKHKKAIFNIWKKYETKVSLYRVIMHDMDKLFFMLFFKYKKANKFHRRYARHHNIKCPDDFYEAYLDWASARITKPDKPLDAIEFAEKYAPMYLGDCKTHYNNVKFK